MTIDRGRVLPIRSISNVRGDLIADVEAATTIGLDAMFIDLEEPRAPFSEHDRRIVRGQVGEWLRTRQPVRGGPRFFVRVQSPQSGQTVKDVAAVICPMLSGVLVPKVEGPNDIVAVDTILGFLEDEHGVEHGTLSIYPILETAKGLRTAYEIANASARVRYMGGAVSRFGDIVQSVGYRWTPSGNESFMFRSAALLDCRAAGLPYPITGPSQHDRHDVAALRRWAVEGRALGYRGSQVRGLAEHVAIMNEAYSPTAEEIAYWRELVTLADGAGDGDAALQHGSENQGEVHVLHLAHIGSARMGLQWAADLQLAAESGGSPHPRSPRTASAGQPATYQR